jgi:signal transduction histidine kinase
VGIAEEEKEMIFRRGYGKHTGLGLNLTREILGITGMTIREVGVPGEGAHFEISVPSGKFRFHGNEMTESSSKLLEGSGRTSGF